MQRPRRILFALVAGGVLLVSLTQAAPASASRQAQRSAEYWPITGFGGYHVHAHVTEVGASWRSPTIRAGSRPGTGSMWIGVQNADAAAGFIQVGEILTETSTRRGVSALFWSDTALDFRPQMLARANPGDLIVARIRRRGRLWAVSVSDVTTGDSETRHLPVSTQVRDDVAEWVLEDPPQSLLVVRDGSFPALGEVRFSHLQLDGRPPSLTRTDGGILMSSDGGVFVPTRQVADGFSMRRPGGFSARYLAFAARVDKSLGRFDYARARWTTLAPAAKAAAALAVARTYTTSNRLLATLPWPARLRHLFALMRRRNEQLSRAYVAWAASGCRLRGAAYAHLISVSRQGAPLTNEMRAALDLPPAA